MSTFNESKHNRQSAGTSIGGQFANKGHPSNEEVTLGGTPWEGEQPTAYDLGLTELGVSSVFVTQEEDGTCTIEAEMDYSTAFHSQRYLAEAQGDEEGAQHFVVRALDEDFNKLVASRYPGATCASRSRMSSSTVSRSYSHVQPSSIPQVWGQGCGAMPHLHGYPSIWACRWYRGTYLVGGM